MYKTFCIVIPVYNIKPKLYEKIAITQLKKIVANNTYPIYYVAPNKMDISEYVNILYGKAEYFDKKYFNNISTYSELCLSYEFYDRFIKYDYMYICQTDVFVNRDEFQLWIDKDFDYIGAPIFDKNSLWKYLPAVGNGGFSLRKISTFKEITSGETRKKLNVDELVKEDPAEDRIICDKIRYKYDLEIPTVKDAAKFAWDQSIDKALKLKQGIPFAFHKFNSTNILILSKIVPELNDTKLIKESITTSYIDICNKYGKVIADKEFKGLEQYIKR